MKFFIETYGCQMNESDSELVSSIMINGGYELADSCEEAEIVIFNTCSIRQRAEERVLGRISNEKGRKLKDPNIKIGVIGCMAQRLQKQLTSKKVGVDFVVGVDQYQKIPQIIADLDDTHRIVEADLNTQEIYDNLYPFRTGNYKAFVTIMRGCDNFCTYCIVPYVRGRERSRAVDEILKEVEEAGNKGFKDITLLGQNVNSYNWQGVRFPELIARINAIESIKRIRFVTSHPKDLSDELINAMAVNSKVCNHIHLPMQSGDDEVLRIMNRKYTSAHFRELVYKLRKAIPEISITTDVIAGFPGETDEQFQRTFDMMQEIEFDFAFMFKYSPREGTKAAEYTNQVAEEIRLERLVKLIDLQTEITHKKYREQVGKIKEIYVEDVSKKSEQELCGKSTDFKIAVFNGTPDMIGTFVKVKVTEAAGWTLRGEII